MRPPAPQQAHGGVRARPRTLRDVRGHADIKRVLDVLLGAARARDACLPHLLFSGPPGLGKTTFALVLAAEAGMTLVHVQGDGVPVAALRAILSNLQERQLVFIDELHRLQGPSVELLYGPLEDGRAVIDGEGRMLPPFTLIGATTHLGRIPAPLRRRFRHQFRLDFVGLDELALVAWYAAGACGVRLSRDACVEVARRSKGAPRRAAQLVEWLADYAVTAGAGTIAPVEAPMVDVALRTLDIGREGFDATDRRYLSALADQFGGGPVGVRSLASVLGEEVDTIEREIEPWLVRMGYVLHTPRGRALGPGPGG